jgi:hypothetical protein
MLEFSGAGASRALRDRPRAARRDSYTGLDVVGWIDVE